MSRLPSALISPADAARLLGVCRRTIDRAREDYRNSRGRDGIGPTYQIGRRCVRVPRAAVLAWVDRYRRPGDAPAILEARDE